MTASEQIEEIIAGLTDWRGPVLARIRQIIRAADPAVTEEVKWRGTPVWSHDGDLCLAKAFKDKVKLTFVWGAALLDPDKLFNSELGGKQWRAIDIFENDEINENSLKALVRAAVDFNHKKASAQPAAKPHSAKGKKSG